eukprot:SAG31_NODE_8167_length_1504_cov_18.731673_2_plen_50_part_01
MRGSQRLKNGEIALLTRHTQLIEAQNTALKKRVTSLESIVVELSKATTTD